MRGLAASAQAAGLAVRTLEMSAGRRAPAMLPAPAELGLQVGLVVADPDVVLAHIGAGVLPGPGAIGRSRMIGFWSWSVAGGLPAGWHDAAPLFDEIWAPSAHAAAAIAPHVPVPVVAMAPPVTALPAGSDGDRQGLGLGQGTFTFLSIFETNGDLDRENPGGAIRAYRMAFPAAGPHRQLLLKIPRLSERQRAGFARAIAGRPDIGLLEAKFDAARMAVLIAGCDCLVSLHRATGFGFAMAQAMAAGRPVIATGHSANMEFMTAETAYPVGFHMVVTTQAHPPFPAGTIWAAPDPAHAARLMRRVEGQPAEAAAKGARAAAAMARDYSPAAAGQRLRARLDLLRLGGKLDMASVTPAAPAAHGRRPVSSILLATPVKDARRYLDRYFHLLERLDHDRHRLSLALLESDSADGTWEALQARSAAAAAHFGRVTLLRRNYGFHPSGLRHAGSIQRQRRSILARSRNRLLAGALADEDWVLWLDVDVIDYPPDLVQQLLAPGKDILVPHCVVPGGRTYDLNSFVLDPRGRPEDPRHLVAGIFQPPRGVGRKYLDSFRDERLVALDAVGGTALLVRADLHREGLNFPAAPYRGYIETEGLGMLAGDMGHCCWGLPDLEVTHAPY